MPNINLTTPYNPYAVDAQAIERQRQLAELMQQQSMGPLQSPVAHGPLGDVTTPISWTQGLAKLLQAYSGTKGQQYANEQEKALGQRYTTDLSNVLQRAMQAGSGTPASTEIMPMDEQANGGLGAANQQINIPAQAPDVSKMASVLMEHPATQPLGQQQMAMNMQRQMLISALTGGGTSPSQAIGNQPAGAGPTPQAASQIGQPSNVGGPAGGVPMAAWLQGDPTGKTYMEQLAKDNAPISTRYGIFQKGPTGAFNAVGGALPANALPYQIGPNGEQRIGLLPGQTEAAAGLKQATESAGQPFKTGTTKIPVYLPGGDQTDVELNPMQMAEYNKTGRLPQEIAASIPGLQQSGGGTRLTAPDDATASEWAKQLNGQGPFAITVVPAQATQGGPVIGRTQTQTERIAQSGQEAQAKSYGSERGQLTAGQPVATLALNDATSNLDRMASLATEIANHPGLPRTTGIIGAIPNLPGSVASDAAAKLETLKSQAAFTVLQSMRAASKSGGALGQVSDKEEQMLANNLAALQKAQSPEAIKDNLLRISAWAQGAKSRMQNAYDMTYKGAAPLPPSSTGFQGTQAGTVRRYNPATRKIE